MSHVLITTPNFGARSDAPWKAPEEHGLTARVEVDRHPLSSAELAAESQGADALIVGLDRVDATLRPVSAPVPWPT